LNPKSDHGPDFGCWLYYLLRLWQPLPRAWTHSDHLNTEPLKTRNIWKTNFLEFSFQLFGPFENNFFIINGLDWFYHLKPERFANGTTTWNLDLLVWISNSVWKPDHFTLGHYLLIWIPEYVEFSDTYSLSSFKLSPVLPWLFDCL
jgi:hypothetical protein